MRELSKWRELSIGDKVFLLISFVLVLFVLVVLAGPPTDGMVRLADVLRPLCLENSPCSRALQPQRQSAANFSPTPAPVPAFCIRTERHVAYQPYRGNAPHAFLLVVENNKVASLPLNPLYFTVEDASGRTYRGGVLPYDERDSLRAQYGGNELQLIELRAGQSATGWIWFDTPPGFTVAALVYDNRFGERFRLTFTR